MSDPAQVHRIKALARGLELARPVSIVDVGANPLNNPPYAALARAGLAELIGFEPQAHAYEAVSAEAPDHARYINAAVGPAGRGTLHVYPGQSGLASLFALRTQTLKYLRRFETAKANETTTEIELSPLDAMSEVPRIDLLKLDAQGAELDVLRGARQKLAGAVAVIVELRYFPLYEGEPSFADVHQELVDQGFMMHKMLDHNRFAVGSRHIGKLNRRKVRSQLIDGDVVYVRALDRIDGAPDDAVTALALLAAGAWGSHDLVLRCLEILEDRGRVPRRIARDYIAALPAEMHRDAPVQST